jgi:hypothetical protein
MHFLERWFFPSVTSVVVSPTRLQFVVLLSLALAMPGGPAARAQEARRVPALRVVGLKPSGARQSTTESWATYDFQLTNGTDSDHSARVLLSFAGQEDLQYGRDVWVPAQSVLSSWLLVGPAPAQRFALMREVTFWLYDRSDGKNQLLLPPGEERTRSRGLLYEKREPSSLVVYDEDTSEDLGYGELPQPESKAEEAVNLVRTFRATAKLSERVHRIGTGSVSPLAQGLDGIDHVVLASERLASDPAAVLALRHWLEQGGKLWVRLDHVRPRAIAPLLGSALDFQVVDHVGLTSFQVESHALGRTSREGARQEHEESVDFVRVSLPGHERVQHTINGWPVWFTRRVGQGKVLFTTLGARGWYRKRETDKGDPPSPFEHFRSLPVPLDLVESVVAAELQPPPENNRFSIESFQKPLTEQIGYSIVGRDKVGWIFGSFLLVTLILGLVPARKALQEKSAGKPAGGFLSRLRGYPLVWRRPELLGWLGPVAALGATAAFLALGAASRQAAAPTLAVAQVVDAVSGKEEASLQGLLEGYRPDSGPAVIGASQGGFFTLDLAATEGQERRLILTDLNAWHWENLAFPAGVRQAAFRYAAATQQPLAAVAHFGPNGLEGKLRAAPFQGLADAIILPANGRNLAVRLQPDGAFSAAKADVLPAGRFLAGNLLTDDRQERRQNLYREFLKGRGAGRLDGRNVLLAWADPIDLHFELSSPPAADGKEGGAPPRTVGTALLVIPLVLERAVPGTRLTVPAPFLPVQRVVEGGLGRLPQETELAMDMDLRFQLPAEVLPFQVERARLAAKIDAPSRRVTVSATSPEGASELRRVESPLDPLDVELADRRWLQLDRDGGLHLHVAVSDLLNRAEVSKDAVLKNEAWKIEYLELEITGRAIGKDEG